MMLDYQRAPSRSHSVSSSTGRTLQVDGDLELRQLDRCTSRGGRWLPRRHPFPSSTDAFTAAGPGPSSAASDGLHVIERVQKRWLPQLTP